MTIDQHLLRGTYKLVYLQLISERDMSGADIIRKLGERTNSVLEPRAGSLYPPLKQLEQDGFVTSYFSKPSPTRSQCMYTITEAGRAELQNRLEAFDLYVDTIYKALGKENKHPAPKNQA